MKISLVEENTCGEKYFLVTQKADQSQNAITRDNLDVAASEGPPSIVCSLLHSSEKSCVVARNNEGCIVHRNYVTAFDILKDRLDCFIAADINKIDFDYDVEGEDGGDDSA
jgi:hypothetical protein